MCRAVNEQEATANSMRDSLGIRMGVGEWEQMRPVKRTGGEEVCKADKQMREARPRPGARTASEGRPMAPAAAAAAAALGRDERHA